MTNHQKPTIEDVCNLITFYKNFAGDWCVKDVLGDVYGNVTGNVRGDVLGDIEGNVRGDVIGDVNGDVVGTINGCVWQYVETPKQKLLRLIKNTGNTELLEAFDQMEDNS